MPRVIALLVSAVAAFGTWLTWRVFVGTGTGQLVEEAAVSGAEFGQTRLWRIAEPILELVSLSFVVLGTLVAIAIALARRRWALAIQAALLILGANVATQVLKRVYFTRPDLIADPGINTLPSGHTTVAASFAAALVLVAPRRARPWLAVLGAGYTAATGVSTLIGQWHRPSDAIAAVLVVLAWSSLLCAISPPSSGDAPLAVRRGERTWPDPTSGETWGGTGVAVSTRRRAASAAGSTAAAAVVLAVGAVITGFPARWGLTQAYEAAESGQVIPEVTTYAGGAFGVAAVSAAAFLLLLLVRQATAKPR